MNSVTSNSCSVEGAALKIPQSDDGTWSGRVHAPLAGAAGTTAAAGLEPGERVSGPFALASRLARVPAALLRDGPAAPPRSVLPAIRATLEAAEARAVRAEERALRAEARLARYRCHCICRAVEVADTFDAEAEGAAAAEPGPGASDVDEVIGAESAEPPVRNASAASLPLDAAAETSMASPRGVARSSGAGGEPPGRPGTPSAGSALLPAARAVPTAPMASMRRR